VVAGNTFDFTALRARLRSAAQVWDVNDSGWIIRSSSLIPFEHNNFTDYVTEGSNLVFRAAPFSKWAEFDGVPVNLPFRFPPAWQMAPAITWTNPESSSFALPDDGNLVPAASIADRDSNMNRISLYYTRDDTGEQTVVFEVLFAQSGSKTLADCFKLAGISSTLNFERQTEADTYYTLTLRVEDSVGNVVESNRFLVRRAETGGGGGLPPPWIGPDRNSFSTYLWVIISAEQPPCDRIQFAVASYGGALPASSQWQTVFFDDDTTYLIYSASRIWARCGTPTAWSAWVFKDFNQQ